MQKVSYPGDDSTTTFFFDFPFYENSNIIVRKNNQDATGYTVIGTSAGLNADIPYNGGKVVFDTAPTAMDYITIERKLPLNRIVDYQPTAQINPQILNQDMNYTMEVLKDMQHRLDEFHTQYSEIIDQDSTKTLISKITDIDGKIGQLTELISSIGGTNIMSHNTFNSYMTNCITAIPQDIRLELNDGTLTLKAGSRVYIPNGPGVFDVKEITADVSTTESSGTAKVLYALSSGGNLFVRAVDNCVSGAGATTSSGFAYDTTTNTIGWYNASGVQQYSNVSFPICICTSTDGKITSIDQVFNGFGYIGSTVFVLPGVRGLIPNGRNNDGTLRNIVAWNDSVHTTTKTTAYSAFIAMAQGGAIDGYGALNYDPSRNMIVSSGNTQIARINAGAVVFGAGGKVTSFEPGQVFSFIS